ncbi:putative virion structural protein [Ralstonia phage RP31]|uniref:Putative virion structural protein n=1 Tax=Ralstonia phage RP31 TaxID=1923890 RepID=A0A1L7N1E1_9CAUD|nr:putative virion structural protein [Ralstonia phage RP31]
MFNNVTFTCTRLNGTNKVGDLKKNERGYYVMVIGALNMFNSAGMYYRADAAKQFFEESSSFMRRVKRGALRGEYGHPRRDPAMSMQAFYARLLQIHEDKVCVHFASVWLDFENYKDDQGRPIVAILAEVAPNGPLGYVLEKQLQNPAENVCFSIRSFTDDRMERGVINRYIKTIVTFDYVNEPGMAVAEKFNSPALEGLEDVTFTRGQVEAGSTQLIEASGVGNESVQLNVHELMNAFGWELPAAAKNRQQAVWSNW